VEEYVPSGELITQHIFLAAHPDPQVSNRFATTLRENGHQVRTTEGGHAALSEIHADPPAVILLPARLTDMSGFEVCKRLRRHDRTRDIPLFIITSKTDEEEEALRSGASDVIPTHLGTREFLRRVEAHLVPGLLQATIRGDGSQRSISLPPEALIKDGWINLALQAGRMYAFEWHATNDAVRRTHGSAAILGIDPSGGLDTATSFLQMIHPADRERFRQVLALLGPAFDVYDTEFRLRRPDGRLIHLRESGRGFFDSDGKLTRVIGITADVTEEVATRNDLQQTRGELLKLVENLPIAVLLTNAQGRIEYINDRFTRNFGYSLEDIVDMGGGREAEPDRPYRREAIENWSNFIAAATGNELDTAPHEHRITGRDGREHLVEVFGAVLGNRKLVLLDDITERKESEAALRESEERFRMMADTAPVMLWVAGKDKRCTFVNAGWQAFTGRAMQQESRDRWSDGVHPDDVDRCLATYAAAFDRREEFQIEYRMRRADGEYGWLLDKGRPRYAADGTFEGYIGSCTDITELKRSQEQILAVQKLESLGVLAGGVAHDFSNFLGCILADADITLSELDTDSPARGGLERIEAVAVRASQIVRQIISYTGEEQQGFETVDISRLVREMLQLLQVCIPKNVSLNIDLPDSLPLPHANAAQLRQVIMNLVLNAGEAIRDEDGEITVSGRLGCPGPNGSPRSGAEPPERESVCLKISDTGAGMTPEVQRRIFDPFFSTKFAGRGLGLAAVQSIVRNHGGSIEVNSSPGGGTSFEVVLPARVPAGGASSEKASVHRGSILIVEDEETLRVSVARMLQKRGFSVLEAANGSVAVDLIHDENQDIAVVLLDLTLPGRSSNDVFNELQRTRPSAKVILTSAYGRESLAWPLRALKRNSFLRKPYRLSELVKVVSHSLPVKTSPSPKTRGRRCFQLGGAK
jgi:PAS domain S-box-containing protein